MIIDHCKWKAFCICWIHTNEIHRFLRFMRSVYKKNNSCGAFIWLCIIFITNCKSCVKYKIKDAQNIPSNKAIASPSSTIAELQHLIIAQVAQSLPTIADPLKHVPIHMVLTVTGFHKDLLFSLASSGHRESIWNL